MSPNGVDFQRSIIRQAEGRMFTPDEVGDRLRLSRRIVETQAQAGVIPGAINVGRYLRVAADQFEAWVRGWWDPATVVWEDWVSDLLAAGTTTTDCGQLTAQLDSGSCDDRPPSS